MPIQVIAAVKALPLVMPTVLKLLPPFVRVMSFAPETSVVTPVTLSTPLCVKAPLVVTLSIPLTIEAPRFRALASVRTTLLPLVIPTVLKLLLPLVSVMSFAPAARVVVPATVTAPVCVIAPPAVAFRRE